MNHPRMTPLFVDLSGKRCLVVGGDRAARDRVLNLLDSGAAVTVVAPDPDQELIRLARDGTITWLATSFSPSQLDGAWLAVSTLADPGINSQIREAATQRQVFLNVVDQPAFCSSYWPALISRPPVVVAISTGGRAPALAGYLRRQLDSTLHPRLGEFADWLAIQRQLLAARLPDLETKAGFWRTLLNSGLPECFLEQGETAAAAMIRTAAEKGE